jgi:hypothetical protein
MAILHFGVQSVSRGRGSSAVGRAAYISRERLRDERIRRNFDYRARGGLEHSEILLPAGEAPSADWARDRGELWNAAEQSEQRRNSRVAREYIVALPHELSGPARIALAREFAQHIADEFHVSTDLAVHRAPPGGDPRNHHAHVLASTRELTAAGFGRKSGAELDERTRRALGLASAPAQLRAMRHQWAERVNAHLLEAGLEIRLDPRPHAERGLAHVPGPHLPRVIFLMERAGRQCEAAERLRELHAARQQHRLALSSRAALASVPAHELPDTASATATDTHAEPRDSAAVPAERDLSPSEREARAIERWRALRRESGRTHEATPDRDKDRGRDHGAEFDF